MKNVFVSVGLILALISVNNIWTDEVYAQSDAEVVSVTVDAVEDEGKKSGLNISLNLNDSEELDEDSIGKIASLVRTVAGDEAAEEVLVELNGLDDEEKAEIKRTLSKGIQIDDGDIPGGAIVAVIGIIAVFGLPLFLLIAVLAFGHRKRRQKMDLIQVYLDSGRDVPHQVLSSFDNGRDSLKSGLILTGAGIGILAAFNTSGEPSTAALGLIPLFVGIAKLAYWFFEERKGEIK